MSSLKYTIGIDFGTLSARAVLADTSDGREICCASFEYPHGVIDRTLPGSRRVLPANYALQNPRDYLEALSVVIPGVIEGSGVDPAGIIGIGVDFTTCTMIPVYADGTPLCFSEKYAGSPHAYVKLWKHHAAQPYANRINQAAEEAAARGEGNILAPYGGRMSSEWLFPKLWEILEEDRSVYDDIAYFIEGGDWIVWQLCGVQMRSLPAAAYKAMYNPGSGYPMDFLTKLNPELAAAVKTKLNAPLIPLGTVAGRVSAESSAKYRLPANAVVVASAMDAQVGAPGAGVVDNAGMYMIMGTSACQLFLHRDKIEMPGICGVVSGGVIPNDGNPENGGEEMFGYEAGQCCFGDHFSWAVDNLTPAAYVAEAETRGITSMRLMIEKASRLRPGESGLIALDWWNGNRNIIGDSDLTGLILGMTLRTRPEEILRALIEANAFGTRVIVENYEKHGLRVDNIVAAGGIALKDPFTMQLFADVLGKSISVVASKQIPALSSAIYAALGAGVYATIKEASAAMRSPVAQIYEPIAKNSAVYNKIYNEYIELHDHFGRGGSNIMKRMLKIQNDM